MTLHRRRMKRGIKNLVKAPLKESLMTSVAKGSLQLNGGYAQSYSIIILVNNWS